MRRIEFRAASNSSEHRQAFFHDTHVTQVLITAFKERYEDVVLKGRAFLIRYEGDKAYIRPREGFVPCGWLTLEAYVKAHEQST